MEKQIVLTNNQGYLWYKRSEESKKTIWVKGFIIVDGKCISGENFLDYLESDKNEQVVDKLNCADGQYSVVVLDGERLLAIVDHIRSFPLFYYQIGEVFYLTDCIHDLDWKQFGMNKEQKALFLNALFTLYNETLLKDVFQVPAGRYLVVERNKVKLHTYWRYMYSEFPIEEREFAVDVIVAGYDKLFAQCRDIIGSRKVVIPLSGGYDSRLVLNGLLKNGVPKERILTFTYGNAPLKDASLSKEVAQAAGVRHFFVEYDTEACRDFFKKKFKEFSSYAANASSVPCVQEWYAVNELKKREVIDENCVFIPGYGGVLPGHYMREEFLRDTRDLSGDIAQQIKLVILGNKPREKEEEKDRLLQKILQTEYFEKGKREDKEANRVEQYEWFIFAEEQAKFIQNAGRTYETVGCKWFSPFLFKSQFELWCRISNRLRVNNEAFLLAIEEYMMPELKSISFTGSKVQRKGRKKMDKWVDLFKLFFDRGKIHYLFCILPYSIYYRYVLSRLSIGINHTIAEEYLRNNR